MMQGVLLPVSLRDRVIELLAQTGTMPGESVLQRNGVMARLSQLEEVQVEVRATLEQAAPAARPHLSLVPLGEVPEPEVA